MLVPALQGEQPPVGQEFVSLHLYRADSSRRSVAMHAGSSCRLVGCALHVKLEQPCAFRLTAHFAGNPTNIIVAMAYRMGFLEYTRWMALPTLGELRVLYVTSMMAPWMGGVTGWHPLLNGSWLLADRMTVCQHAD